jgi:NAD(P)-dependent dehydrogenase (short-subunit alcohol dehydrogenase family)
LFQALTVERVQFAPMDITDADSIDRAIANGNKQFGSVDACVNAAYPCTETWGAPFEKLKMEDLHENLKLQLGGAIILSQRLMKHFMSQGHGNFIHISSIQGIAAPKFEHYEGTLMTSPIEYSAIKSGIIAMTRWMAKYHKNKNIRVNCVSPGGILDQQQYSFLEKYRESCTSKGMLDPTDVAGTVLFLLSDQSKYINGQNIIIDDGWTL